MSYIFKIDTDSLESIAYCLSEAKNNVDSCVLAINSVTSHDDWTCKERYQINELLNDLKTSCNAFAQEYELNAIKIKQESDNYRDYVKEEVKSGVEVDAKINELFSLLSGTSIDLNTQTQNIYTNIQSIIEKIKNEQIISWSEMTRYQRHVLYNCDKPICVADYNMVFEGIGDR